MFIAFALAEDLSAMSKKTYVYFIKIGIEAYAH